jgi:ribosomal protein S18 acetylase RimI-like enzyme
VTTVLLMCRDLTGAPASVRWPAGVRLGTFAPSRAAEVHVLLAASFADGEMGTFEDWWRDLAADGEYDPALIFLALSTEGRIVGVAHCWTSAFVKDLAVDPAWRQQGIAQALLGHAFLVFRARGAKTFSLKVRDDNASAIRLYLGAGMRILDRIVQD